MPDGPRAGRRLAALLALAAMAVAVPARAGDTVPSGEGAAVLSPGQGFAERSGEALFANVCRGCHMDGARGAAGAATYPSLAGDPTLRSADYVAGTVVNGLRGMPAFGWAMDDAQVAAVATYVRTHFGNRYDGPVTADEVEQARR